MAGRHTLEEEFHEFVSARSAALLRTAYLLAGDWATAEDLLQTTLTKTYLAWKRLGQIEAVEPYARRVLVNTATSWWRRRWHGERPTEILPERPAPDQFEEQLERDALWRHVRTLPARQRAILVLRYYEDMSEAQAAAMLNISPGTVKSQTSRALATLRRRLGPEVGVLPTVAAGPVAPGRPVTRTDRADTGAPTRNPQRRQPAETGWTPLDREPSHRNQPDPTAPEWQPGHPSRGDLDAAGTTPPGQPAAAPAQFDTEPVGVESR